MEVRWEGKTPVAELTGDIVKLIVLPSREGELSEDVACSAKVVAGAGFEPATFRL